MNTALIHLDLGFTKSNTTACGKSLGGWNLNQPNVTKVSREVTCVRCLKAIIAAQKSAE